MFAFHSYLVKPACEFPAVMMVETGVSSTQVHCFLRLCYFFAVEGSVVRISRNVKQKMAVVTVYLLGEML